ncbi:hypothetical protein [Nocardia tengchongensis]|uniref:hypothetical protein n=1 Tax=Nocardia tengchongensis TaxID=2055889 RepID=UPI00360E4E9D
MRPFDHQEGSAMFAMTRQTVARAVLAGAIAVAPVTAVTVPTQADVVTNYAPTPVDQHLDHGSEAKHFLFPPGWGIPPGWFKHLLPFEFFDWFDWD